jgi:hypothetical protein
LAAASAAVLVDQHQAMVVQHQASVAHQASVVVLADQPQLEETLFTSVDD